MLFLLSYCTHQKNRLNLSAYENNPFYIGIKLYNLLKLEIKLLTNTNTSKNCYSLNEYFES